MTALSTSSLTGVQKSAILLIAMGDRASADLLRHLSDDEIQAVTEAIATLPTIPQHQTDAVLEEFQMAAGGAAGSTSGGFEFARRVITSAFGPDAGKKHLERLPQPPSEESRRLQRLDPALLARFVESEHPQTVAMVLSHLNAPQSAAVLRAMSPAMQTDVTIRLARLERISPAVMAKISAVITKKLKSIGELKSEASGGLRAVAEIFNQLDNEVSSDILALVSEQDPQLVEDLRQKMFVFEDLLSIDANGLKELLARVDRRQLTIALKGTSEELRKHLLQGMSQRGASMLLEDMEALGPVKIREVEGARQVVISLLRQLETEGVVSLKGGSDDQFIV